MKTNKLPQSAWSDSKAAGSQSQQINQSKTHYQNDNEQHVNTASNDASYDNASYDNASYDNASYDNASYDNASNDNASNDNASNDSENYNDTHSNHLAEESFLQDSYLDYKSIDKGLTRAKEFAMIENGSINDHDLKSSTAQGSSVANGYKKASGYKKAQKKSVQKVSDLDALISEEQASISIEKSQKSDDLSLTTDSYPEIPERVFMNGLIKHTGIALAIIIPLAAFSAYAAPLPASTMTTGKAATAKPDKAAMETLSVKPSDIIHKSANTPTTVDSVDLKKYAGTWYEIGRLPMYFQRNCAGDVTANYTQKTDGSGIIVTNKCKAEDGSEIIAEGLAKPDNDTGSKLKVTFLPSWIRWLPVGRADYWVLARDSDYKTALVGTPDKDYLWLLARSPNVSQETYAKYRQIAQQQGYDLKEFQLTAQSNQTVTLVP